MLGLSCRYLHQVTQEVNEEENQLRKILYDQGEQRWEEVGYLEAEFPPKSKRVLRNLVWKHKL